MLGYGHPNELTMQGIASFTHPEDCELQRRPMQQLMARTISHFSLEKRYLHRDGHVVWGHTTVSVVWDAAGQPQHTIAVVQDISDRKRAEAQVQQLQAELEQRVQERTAQLEASQPRTQRLCLLRVP